MRIEDYLLPNELMRVFLQLVSHQSSFFIRRVGGNDVASPFFVKDDCQNRNQTIHEAGRGVRETLFNWSLAPSMRNQDRSRCRALWRIPSVVEPFPDFLKRRKEAEATMQSSILTR